MAFDQVWPTKQPDGTVFERHVYSGPQGDGFIDIVYQQNGADLEVKYDHHGPEQRNLPAAFVKIDETKTKALVRDVIEDKVTWTEDDGIKAIPVEDPKLDLPGDAVGGVI